MNSKQPSEAEQQQPAAVQNKRARLDDSALLPLRVPETPESIQNFTSISISSRLESENKELRLRLDCAELKLTVGELRTEIKEAKWTLEKEEEKKKEAIKKWEEAEQRIAKLEDSLLAKEHEMEEWQKELDKTKAEMKEENKALKRQIGQLKQKYQHKKAAPQESFCQQRVLRGLLLTKETKNELLRMAVEHSRREGDCDKYIRELLQSGANPNAMERDSEQSVLHLAAGRGFAKVVTQLLDRGALVDLPATANGSHGFGPTALHFALEKCHTEVVKLLIGRGANLEPEDLFGNRPLHYAAKFCSKEVVQLLLDKGADINVGGRDGQSALHFALEHRRIDVAQLLIRRGADTRAEDELGDQPIHYAVDANSTEIVGLVLDQSDSINTKDHFGKTPLHIALEEPERICIVKMLLERGADVEAQDNEGERPLWYAVNLDKPDIVQLLLEHKASPDAKNSSSHGYTAIHLAATHENVEIVDMLFQKEANLEAEDYKKKRPLHFAVMNGNLEVVKFLLKLGIKIDCVNSDGCSALHYSVIYDHDTSAEIAEILLDHAMENGGKKETLALMNLRDREGNNALDLARQHKRVKAIKLFEAKGKL